jgi:uncharacterized membrane-anchored protein YjiN (DUF445 family)
MPLPIPIWIAAAVAALAGFAATRSRGKKEEKSPTGLPQDLSSPYPRLTLRELCTKYLPRFAASVAPDQPKERMAYKPRARGWIQYANLCFFPLCALAFTASFVYANELLRILSVSGIIGFGTNWLAIMMLFHPRQKRVLLGQGLIPKQREKLVEAIANGVSRNLINEDIIREQLEKSGLVQKITSDFKDELHALLGKPDFRADLRLLIETTLRDLTEVPEHRERILKLSREMLDRLELEGVVGRLLTFSRPVWQDSALAEFDKWVSRELPTVLNKNLDLLDGELVKLPAMLEKERDAIERWLTGTIIYFVKRLDIRKTMLEQLRTFDEEQVEKLIRDASNDQLGYITLLGGVLGFIAGFVLWHPAALLWIAAGALGVIAADLLLTWLATMRRRPMAT